jgi:hypothetical protein
MEENEALVDDTFVVKQSLPLILIIGGFAFVAILSTVAIEVAPIIIIIGAVVLLVLIAGLANNEILRIDCNGIYQKKVLVTNWENFLQAKLSEGKINRNDNPTPILLLYYQKVGIAGQFKMTIPLTNTQNKGEEDIVEAIYRYHRLWQKGVMPLKQPLTIGNNEAS